MENSENEKNGPEEGSQLNRNRSLKSKQLVRSQALRETHSPPRTISPCVAEPVKNSVIVVDVTTERVNVTTEKDNVIIARNNIIAEINNVIKEKDNVIIETSNVTTERDNGKTERCNVNTETDNGETEIYNANTETDNAITESYNVKMESEPRTITVSSDESSQTYSDNCSEVQCFEEKKQHVEIQITGGNWEGGRSTRGSRLLGGGPRVGCVCGACACTRCRGRRRQHQCPMKQDSGIVYDREDAASDNEISDSTPAGDTLRKSASMDDECRCTERRDRIAQNFNRYDTDSDLTGPELVRFIKETLNKNSRDRITLLRIERELHELVNNNGRCVVRFPAMSSYGRLLVHRCASLFQLNHRLDPFNKTSVLVSKNGTAGGQIPCTQFKQWCTASFPEIQHAPTINNNNNNAKSILKRASGALESRGGAGGAAARCRSLQQRQQDYQRVRSRIFSEDNCTTDESQWPWLPSGPVKLLTPDGGRKLLKVQSLESAGAGGGARRGAVAKSHSFGGEPHTHRILSRQGDLASSSWRLSPSSSGYKTLSLRSTDSVTPSPTGGASPEPTSVSTNPPSSLVWAVTDLARVPVGAVVIHPQTGRPLSNPDGSLYHFDPANPPPIYDPPPYEQTEDLQTDQNNDRRRGRLEKQHSFIDNECECPSPLSEEFTTKCCFGCRRSQSTNNNNEMKPETDKKPPSPNIAYENANIPPNPPESTNHDPPKNPQPANDTATNKTVDVYSTNQQPSCDQAANQRVEYEPTNQMSNNEVDRNQLTSRSCQELYVPHANYNPYNNEELSPPPQLVSRVYSQPDMSVHPAQAKVAPIIHDPNIQQMALSNVMYPAPCSQSYPYMNQYRTEQQPIYQQVPDAHKQMINTHTNDNNTFRIDPSYPYPPVDYAQCGPPCNYLEPTYNTTHRPSYNMNYGQMEVPNIMPTNVYSAPPVVLPPTHHYPYQDAMQWPGVQPMLNIHREVNPKVLLHDLYPYCGLVCPPMVPPYSMCGGVYPPPPSTPRPYNNDDRGRSPEIAVTIQHIKQQMAQLNTDNHSHREHNNENGILGSHPGHDDAHLSCAARAIVNSIRNIQTRNSFHTERAREYQPRRRYDDKRPLRPHHAPHAHHAPPAPPAPVAPVTPVQLAQVAHAQAQARGMGPNNWYRRSPAPGHPLMNHPRRQHPNGRNERR